jgi:predicted HAD superfamily hydrolase
MFSIMTVEKRDHLLYLSTTEKKELFFLAKNEIREMSLELDIKERKVISIKPDEKYRVAVSNSCI